LKYFNVATSKDDPDAWRQKQDEKEDAEYAKSVKRIKDNLPDKLELECPDNDKLKRKATNMTLAAFGFENWAKLSFGQIEEEDFINTFREFVEMGDVE
jgi:hypothetical protein